MAKNPYITVENKPDGSVEVVEHKSKKDAHSYGMEKRRSGATIFAHSAEFARKHKLDPRIPSNVVSLDDARNAKARKQWAGGEKPQAAHGSSTTSGKRGGKYAIINGRKVYAKTLAKLAAKKGDHHAH